MSADITLATFSDLHLPSTDMRYLLKSLQGGGGGGGGGDGCQLK